MRAAFRSGQLRRDYSTFGDKHRFSSIGDLKVCRLLL